MQKIYLREKEQNKYDCISKFVNDGETGNKKRLAHKLNLNKRTVNRLIKKFKEKGKSAFVHGNRSKMPSIKYDQHFSDDIITLYKNNYKNYSFKHFKDKLEENHKIHVSYCFLYNLLMKEDIQSPFIQKKTKKRVLKAKILTKNKKICDEEAEKIASREVADPHPRQEKPKYFGEIIEMDASQHKWFNNIKSHLHLAIDKCSGIVVGGYFAKEETLNGYYNVFSQILSNYGIPAKFITDNRTVFNYNRTNKKSEEKDILTQFGYACRTLGVDIETTSVSQAKGTIERANGTYQRRLVNELATKGILDIESANKYLIEVFIPYMNNKFASSPSLYESVFETPPTYEKINYTLAVLSSRIYDNGSAIKFKKNYYLAYRDGEQANFLPKTKCLVIEAFDGTLLVAVNDEVLELKELNKHQTVSKEYDIEIENKPKEKKKYKPPMSHPWRTTVYDRYKETAHTYNIYNNALI